MMTTRSLVSARKMARRRARTANFPLWNSHPSHRPPFPLAPPRAPWTSYIPGAKNSAQVSNPAAPFCPVFFAPAIMSWMSLGWLHSFFSAVMAARTMDCLPVSAALAALDSRKCSYRECCSGVSLHTTTSTTLGGRCLDRMVLVRRRTNLFTSSLSSALRSTASANSASLAPGSRPARIGRSKCLWNCAGGPNSPGLQKFTML